MDKLTPISGFIYTNEIDNRSFGAITKLNKNGMVTLTECKELYGKIAAKLLKDGEFIKSYELELSDYKEYNKDGSPVYASEENPFAVNGLRKKAKYFVKQNMLRIYEDNMPIYENANGVICTDKIALCDSLC